jgi:glycosyltransferase involved in cell wall biosynthesis
MRPSDVQSPEIPVISVISACCNHGKYVMEMVASVLAQTFHDCELIIVNDGSTDNTREVLDALQCPRVRVVHTQNRGPSLARNRAIEDARGSIILNLDADDRIASTLLEKAHAAFSSHPGVRIVTCRDCFFGAKSGPFRLPPFTLETMLTDNVIISSSFFRKEDWRRVGGYSNEFPFGLEDWDFWLSLIELGGDVYTIPEELHFYRTYPRARSCRSGKRKASRKKLVPALLTIFDRHAELYSRCPEVRERMLRLRNQWETEGVLMRELKEILHVLLFWMHEVTNGC